MLIETNHKNLYRDTNSMGISVINEIEKQQYFSKINTIKSQNEQIKRIDNEINIIKEDINEIKSLLLKILEK